MHRVCLTKSGELFEFQSGGRADRIPKEVIDKDAAERDAVFTDEEYQAIVKQWDDLEAMRLNTLTKNALDAGYKEDEIEVKWVTDAEWAAIQAAQSKPEPSKEQLIQKEMLRLLREQAIANLTAAGKI